MHVSVGCVHSFQRKINVRVYPGKGVLCVWVLCALCVVVRVCCVRCVCCVRYVFLLLLLLCVCVCVRA